jgi:hypothetical protein
MQPYPLPLHPGAGTRFPAKAREVVQRGQGGGGDAALVI